MRLIGRHKLNHPSQDANDWLKGWTAEVSAAQWKDPAELFFQFPKAALLKPGFFVFPVADLDLSLELNIVFPQGIACVVGLHESFKNGN